MKLLSIAVPSYNAAAYLDRCMASLLPGGEDVEILIVDDGSTDDTAAMADAYEKQYPTIVKAIHQKNGGHGAAVNTGIDHATGLYFKVVDSDDWLDEKAFPEVLAKLREFTDAGCQPDMVICNYIYDKEEHKKVVNYRVSLPANRLFTWREVGPFRPGHYILMHSAIFRTSLLQSSGMRLPEHCFYVDNICVFEPLVHVRNMVYLNKNLYHYYIGRSDQSVNEEVMTSRLDQQMRVNRIMVDYYTDPDNQRRIRAYWQRRRYMYRYLEIITAISSVLAVNSGKPEHLKMKEELWDYIHKKNRGLYIRLRSGALGVSTNLPGRGGRLLTVSAYRIARHFFNFN